MKQTITVVFKDGNVISVEPKQDMFGCYSLGNGMTFSNVTGTLYKEKGNVICGEDITDTVDAIEISMKY